MPLVLTNEDQRLVYDRHGMHGVHAFWQLEPAKHPLLNVLEALDREKAMGYDGALLHLSGASGMGNLLEMTLARNLESSHQVQISLDASLPFDSEDEEELEIVEYLPTLRSLGFEHSIYKHLDIPIMGPCSFDLTLSILKKYKMGAVSVSTGFTKQVSEKCKLALHFCSFPNAPSGIDALSVDTEALGGPTLNASIEQVVGNGTVLACSSTIPLAGLLGAREWGTVARPVESLTLQHTLNPRWIVSVALNSYTRQPSVSLVHIEDGKADNVGILTLSPGLVQVKKSLILTDCDVLSVRASLGVGVLGLETVLAHRWPIGNGKGQDGPSTPPNDMLIDKTPMHQSSISINSDASRGISVTLTQRIHSLDLSIPILFCNQILPIPLMLAYTLPYLTASFIRHYVYLPWKAKRQAQFWEHEKERISGWIAKARLDAEVALQVQRQTHGKKKATSELVITRAIMMSCRLLGKAGGTGDGGSTALDVSVQLQFQVSKGRLVIDKGTQWTSLLGIWDFDYGSMKELLVEYSFRGKEHRAVFKEGQTVAIPMQDHLLPRG